MKNSSELFQRGVQIQNLTSFIEWKFLNYELRKNYKIDYIDNLSKVIIYEAKL